jgi:hypothetical protein
LAKEKAAVQTPSSPTTPTSTPVPNRPTPKILDTTVTPLSSSLPTPAKAKSEKPAKPDSSSSKIKELGTPVNPLPSTEPTPKPQTRPQAHPSSDPCLHPPNLRHLQTSSDRSSPKIREGCSPYLLGRRTQGQPATHH